MKRSSRLLLSTLDHSSCFFTDTQESWESKIPPIGSCTGIDGAPVRTPPWFKVSLTSCCQATSLPVSIVFQFLRFFGHSESLEIYYCFPRSIVKCCLLPAARRMATAAVLNVRVQPLGMTLHDIFWNDRDLVSGQFDQPFILTKFSLWLEKHRSTWRWIIVKFLWTSASSYSNIITHANLPATTFWSLLLLSCLLSLYRSVCIGTLVIFWV